MLKKPPPDPKAVTAPSGPEFPFKNLVAPIAVTYGEDPGYEGNKVHAHLASESPFPQPEPSSPEAIKTEIPLDPIFMNSVSRRVIVEVAG